MNKKIRVKTYKPSHRWEGECIDTGAQTAIIGLKQARALCKFLKIKLETKQRPPSFRFGDSKCKSLGTIDIVAPSSKNLIVSAVVDAVCDDVPFPVGLDLLGKRKLYLIHISDNPCSKQLK